MNASLYVERSELEVLHKRRSFQSLPQALALVGTFSVFCFVGQVAHRWWLWPILWWFQGFLLSCFLGAAHDCAHGTFAKSAYVNRRLGALWATAVLFNFTIYKHYHLEHHKHTTVEGDTEPLGAFPSLRDYLFALPMTGYFSAFWKMSFLAMIGRFPHFIRTEQARRAVWEDNIALLAWICAVGSLTCWAPLKALQCYWGPMLIYFPMVFLTSVPEHYGCEEGEDPLRNTRSLSPNPIFRFFFWNGNYHAEHHAYPGVPSRNLHRLHKMIGDRFVYQETSYIRFHLRVMRELANAEAPHVGPQMSPLTRVEYSIVKPGNAKESDSAMFQTEKQS